jgi:HD-GYP domain-containing protein (c-di-GMP phosphodiesterase class II)
VATLMLRVYAVVSSPWLSMLLAGVLSLAASCAGAWYWRRRRGGGALLFSDLLIWGWLRRRRQDRKLADAVNALGLDRPDGAGPERSLSAPHAERVLSQLVDALESQDVYLRGHSRRVARHAAMIAQGMRLPAREVDRVRAAAIVHDVGKLRTPWQIVNKPSRLSDAEFELIKLHPLVGAEMTAALTDPELSAIVRHHHERVDGTGYPDGLRGDEIPLGARIVAVADTFDAVTSRRPYRGPARHQRAIEILRQASGSQLDPAAVRAFLTYYSGHRLAVAWAMACAAPRQIIGVLNGEAVTAPVSSGKLAASVLMSAAIASSAAVAPIVAVNSSGPLTAAPSISAELRASTSESGAFAATIGARGRDGEHDQSSSPARRLATPFAPAGSPAAQTPTVLIGSPAVRQATNPASASPSGGAAHASGVSAMTSLFAPPTPTPTPTATTRTSATASPTPTSTGTTAPTGQVSSTVSVPMAQAPVTTTPPSPPSHPQPAGGPGSGTSSGNASGGPDARGPTDAGPTSPSAGTPGTAAPHDNGQSGNSNAQGNPGDRGNTGDQGNSGGEHNGDGQANGDGQGNATGQSSASGQATGAPQNSPGARSKANGHVHAGS